MKFTDGHPMIVTEENLTTAWNGGKNAKYFRCYICGYKFKLGDYYRFIFGNKSIYCPPIYPKNVMSNVFVCKRCDNGPNEHILEEYEQMRKDYKEKYWSLHKEDLR